MGGPNGSVGGASETGRGVEGWVSANDWGAMRFGRELGRSLMGGAETGGALGVKRCGGSQGKKWGVGGNGIWNAKRCWEASRKRGGCQSGLGCCGLWPWAGLWLVFSEEVWFPEGDFIRAEV